MIKTVEEHENEKDQEKERMIEEEWIRCNNE